MLLALAFSAATLMILPFSDIVSVHNQEPLELRQVETTTWQPKPLQLPVPRSAEMRASVMTPLKKSKPTLETPEELPTPKLRLPVTFDFTLKNLGGDFDLDFDIAAAVQEIPASVLPPEKTLFDVSELDRAPRAIAQSAPIYPYSARVRKVEGYVELKFVITAQGTVTDIHVLASAPGNLFNRAAEQAVSRWRFEPGIKNQKTVDTWARIRLTFELER